MIIRHLNRNPVSKGKAKLVGDGCWYCMKGRRKKDILHFRNLKKELRERRL